MYLEVALEATSTYCKKVTGRQEQALQLGSSSCRILRADEDDVNNDTPEARIPQYAVRFLGNLSSKLFYRAQLV